jgi:hypothetical protein
MIRGLNLARSRESVNLRYRRRSLFGLVGGGDKLRQYGSLQSVRTDNLEGSSSAMSAGSGSA